ncbi:hypothetical protein VRU48_09030 [Pedobacter sp. KR3-3]|uniref:Uncharacterized protein n=1 Tax=Pedobacter albus TaxID=3113905 RepID=A0ABU7I702_9SPHI|nr:hypothetical protein [Pedobacter sp. KR3-3]MEE1945250.1 hypothetical protein [Pedobacter sp. KR3-3]
MLKAGDVNFSRLATSMAKAVLDGCIEKNQNNKKLAMLGKMQRIKIRDVSLCLSAWPFKQTLELIGETSMRFTLKSAAPNRVDLTSQIHQLNAFVTATDQLLARVDIIAAIDYYGITELLDAIGEESLKAHLECLKQEINPTSPDLS